MLVLTEEIKKAYNVVFGVAVKGFRHWQYASTTFSMVNEYMRFANVKAWFLRDLYEAHHDAAVRCLILLHDLDGDSMSLKRFLNQLGRLNKDDLLLVDKIRRSKKIMKDHDKTISELKIVRDKKWFHLDYKHVTAITPQESIQVDISPVEFEQLLKITFDIVSDFASIFNLNPELYIDRKAGHLFVNEVLEILKPHFFELEDGVLVEA